MALKAAANGTYNVKNLKEAKEAMNLFQAVKGEIEEIREANGLPELELEATELKKAVTRWAVATQTDRIDFDKGFHATLVQQFYDAQYIGTDADMPDSLPEGREVITLQAIIEKKFKSKIKTTGSKARKAWFAVTKRVVDKEAIDQAVASGLLTVDEIAPSFVEKQKAPYLRVFEE